ncbi:hypothetical protein ACV3KX_002124 [Listeria monocytogenes]
MTTKYKKHKLANYLGLIVIMASFFVTPITTLAATVNYEKIANYVSTWYLSNPSGLHWTDDGVHMIKAGANLPFVLNMVPF